MSSTVAGKPSAPAGTYTTTTDSARSRTAGVDDRSRDQRSCDASDADQGALGVREVTDDKTIR